MAWSWCCLGSDSIRRPEIRLHSSDSTLGRHFRQAYHFPSLREDHLCLCRPEDCRYLRRHQDYLCRLRLLECRGRFPRQAHHGPNGIVRLRWLEPGKAAL